MNQVRRALAPLIIVPAIILSVLALSMSSGPAMAAGIDLVTMRSSVMADGGRLSIEWSAPIKVLQKQDGNQLVLRFSRPLSISIAPALIRLASYLNVDRSRVEGTDLTLDLRPGVVANLQVKKSRIVAIDLTREPNEDKNVGLRMTSLQNGVRLVFAWPEPISLTSREQEGSLLVTVNSAHRLKQTDLRFLNETLQPWFSEARQSSNPGSTSLAFDLRPMIVSSVRRAGERDVEIDLLRDASSLTPKPAPKPKPIAEASSPPRQDLPPLPAPRPSLADSTVPIDRAASNVYDSLPNRSANVDALTFQWSDEVGAAVFKRAGYLWVVFDAPPVASGMTLPPPSPAPLMPGEVTETDGATIVRFRMTSETGFDIRREAPGHWSIHPVGEPTTPASIAIAPGEARGTLLAKARSSGRVIDIDDPLVGDRISIWPLRQAGFGQPGRRRFVDLDLLPSMQGLVWRPLNDDLTVTSTDDGIRFGSQKGLALTGWTDDSPADDDLAKRLATNPGTSEGPVADDNRTEAGADAVDDTFETASVGAQGAGAGEMPSDDQPPASYLDLAGSGLDRNLVAETRRVLRQRIARAAPEDRDRARLDLARLLVAEKFASEAKIVLQTIPDERETMAAKSKRALIGAAAFLTGDIELASTMLNAAEFDEDDEIGLWRSALISLDRDWPSAAAGWKTSQRQLDAYPPKLLFDFGLLALEAAIKIDDDDMIRKGFRRLKTLDLKPDDMAKVERLHALRAIQDGDLERAKELLQKIVDGGNSRTSIIAEFELATLMQSENPDDGSLLAALKERLPLWRGHPEEIDMIDRLARQYREADKAREALGLWAHLADIHPQTANDQTIKTNRGDTYADALTRLAGDKIDLFDAYSIYLDFIDLLPEKPDDRLIHRRLAEHLAGLDLLGEAVRILQPLLESATDTAEANEIGAEIADLLLLQNRPGEALAALDRSDRDDQAGSTAIEIERLILRARALAALERSDEALEQLQDLQTREARHVRATILWQQQNWSRLASTIEAILEDPALPSPLEDRDQKLVLWLALARERLGSTDDLKELRRRYAVGLAGGRWWEAFIVATQAADQRGDLTSMLRSAKEQLAELGSFRNAAKALP